MKERPPDPYKPRAAGGGSQQYELRDEQQTEVYADEPRCCACGDIALVTDDLCAKCAAWSAYGHAIDGRGDPAVFVAGVRRFRRYQESTQPAAIWRAFEAMRRRIAALEVALGWQEARFDDLHAEADVGHTP